MELGVYFERSWKDRGNAIAFGLHFVLTNRNMSTSYHSGAAGSLAGFTWQKWKALLALLMMREEGVVELEGDDDVVVLNLNGEIITSYQHKHSLVSGTITTKSTELWKTIRVWSEVRKKASPDTKFILATTDTASSSLIPFRDSTDSSPTNADIDQCEKAMSDIAKSNRNKELTECYKSWQGMNVGQRKKLLKNFRLADNNPKLNKIDEEILEAVIYRTSLSANRAIQVQERMLGWFEREVSYRLNLKGCKFTSKEFKAILERFRDEALPPPIVFRSGADEYTDEEVLKEKQTNPMYLKQLELLAASEELYEEALVNVLRARTERQNILDAGMSGQNDVDLFDRELLGTWTRLYLRYVRSRTVPATNEEANRKIGWRIYDGCMGYSAYIGLTRIVTPAYLSCGSFHLLSDHLKVGWHPEFESRLRKRKAA